MLDLGITKMALIGVVALVVLGPERLPRVARTAGAVWSRAQRYINDVKTEVTRELELEELRRMTSGFESAARDIGESVHATVLRDDATLTSPPQSAAPAASIVPVVASAPLNKRNGRLMRAATQARAARPVGHRSPALLGTRRVMRPAPTALRQPRHYSGFNTHIPKRGAYSTQARAV
ncbi:Sec-independent protein translocase subunit TatB [Paraburkholderia sp. LEh10]|nr:Sec-independent protein translocase protein TatB [Paraburkholderia sp. LEh10]MBP0594091.1 Sec-independent protein translocase subunit TatB [Paraburkholderia sp. LEh10]